MDIEEVDSRYPNAVKKIKSFVKRCPVCKSIELPILSFWRKEYFAQGFLDKNAGGPDDLLIVTECNCPIDARYVILRKIKVKDIEEYEKQAQKNVPEHLRKTFW